MAAIDLRRLEDLLAGDPFVSRVVVLESTPSTNDEAHRLGAQGAREGTVVLADRQTAGRGRLGRSWHSPPGVGLYVSVLLRPGGPIEELTRWTIASAVAACEACREVSRCDVIVRWPNDLLASGRKVAGTLAELRSTGPLATDLVLGTGINVNHGPEDFPEELRERAISLRMASSGTPVDRELLAALYLRGLGRMSRALSRGDWQQVADAWASLAPDAHGRRVRVTPGVPVGARAFEGTTRGLDRMGGLLVERLAGTVVSVHLGESVVALEG